MIKDEVTCKICDDILCRPMRCRNCEYAYCQECLQLAGSKCPNCNQKDEFDSKVLGVYRILDRLDFKCLQCGQSHNYSALSQCDQSLCPDCNNVIDRDDFLHKCSYRCWNCQESFSSTDDLKTHFSRSNCRPELKEYCEICNTRFTQNLVVEKNNKEQIKSTDNEKMNEEEIYPENYNEAQSAHDKIECLDRKINFAFDVLYCLVHQLSLGNKPDLQSASTQHTTGMLTKAQMYANHNDKIAKEIFNEDNRIMDTFVHEECEARIVSRLNFAEIYDERSSTLLVSHHFERTKVNSAEDYEYRVKTTMIDDIFLRFNLHSNYLDIVNLWSPYDLLSIQINSQMMQKIEQLARKNKVYQWIKSNVNLIIKKLYFRYPTGQGPKF
eukprot:Mrub_04860.p1 GENE.Mrub_04860~~Mrub_04860.p1  ORF type:complete len:398 (-),score=53.24 Mrub_04860:13-1158(-)